MPLPFLNSDRKLYFPCDFTISKTNKIGVDYNRLFFLLRNQKWQEADWETWRLLEQAANQVGKGQLQEEDIENISIIDIQTIDRLWMEHSNEHFGFSIQRQIWLEEAGKIDYETECKLGDRVGWRKNGRWLDYPDLTFNLNAPLGQFPVIWSVGSSMVAGLRYDKGLFILSRKDL